VSGDSLDGALADPTATAALLTESEPEVISVALTGPTDTLADVVETVSPQLTDLLEVDFDRGAPQTCGCTDARLPPPAQSTARSVA
jgi:hypothetical protein